MASRATYSDADKAAVYVVLTTNEGNVKRTAREANVPETTVRAWKAEWEKNGPPPLEEVTKATTVFLDEAKTVRGMALEVLRAKVELLKANPKEARIAELTTLVGVLDDKISRAAGLERGGRVDHFHHLPAPDELRALMGEYVSGSISAAERRAEEIVDAEIVEQAALPPGR